MFCANCGKAVEEGVQFCKSCGAPTPQLSAAPPLAPSLIQPPPPPRRNRMGLIIGSVVGGIIVLAALGVGLYFGLRGNDSDGAISSRTTIISSALSSSPSVTAAEAAFLQNEGEIFLEPAGNAGPESFTGETFVPAGPSSTLNIPTTTPASLANSTTTQPVSTKTTVGGTVQVASYTGDTPALYGGSKSKQLADKEGQLRFFEQNPDKAAAFCEALNSDPTFKWSGGSQIRPGQLRDFFTELTPLMLTRDTRVTNHGYRDGHPTPRQSVLQKGQLVLVDSHGVPRVRCECGNPLIPPKAVKKAPTYTGPKWTDFDPVLIVVVQPTTVIIETFVVIDVSTGETFVRPAGTTGDQDTSNEAETSTTSTSTTLSSGGVKPVELFNNGNTGGISGGGGTPPIFELTVATQITELTTYHYVAGGLPAAGTISLKGKDGTLYGPFQATGAEGQGGVANAVWTIKPKNLILPAGSYTIIDSDPASFSQNAGSHGVGMAWLSGIPQQ